VREVNGALKVARVLRRPFALHHRDNRQLLVRQAVGLHVAQHGIANKIGGPVGPLGCSNRPARLAGDTTLRGAPDAGAAALAMGDQHRLAEACGDRRGGVADMDHERAAADRSAVIGVLKVARGFLAAHSRCTTIASWSCVRP
jgi:hypothetical protein